MESIRQFVQTVPFGPGIVALAVLGLCYVFLSKLLVKYGQREKIVASAHQTPTASQKVCTEVGGTWTPVSPPPNVAIVAPGEIVTRFGNAAMLCFAIAIGVVAALVAVPFLRQLFQATGYVAMDEIIDVLQQPAMMFAIAVLIGFVAGLLVLWLHTLFSRKALGLPTGQKLCENHPYEGHPLNYQPITDQPNMVILREGEFIAKVEQNDFRWVVKVACGIAAVALALTAWNYFKLETVYGSITEPTATRAKKALQFVRNAQLADRRVYRQKEFDATWGAKQWTVRLSEGYLEKMMTKDGKKAKEALMEELQRSLVDKGNPDDIEIVKLHSITFVGDSVSGKLLFGRCIYDASLKEKVDTNGIVTRKSETFLNKPFAFTPARYTSDTGMDEFFEQGNKYLVESILPLNTGGGSVTAPALLTELPMWPAIAP